MRKVKRKKNFVEENKTKGLFFSQERSIFLHLIKFCNEEFLLFFA